MPSTVLSSLSLALNVRTLDLWGALWILCQRPDSIQVSLVTGKPWLQCQDRIVGSVYFWRRKW